MGLDDHKPTPCALCHDPAVAVYYLSRGCVARPDLTVQPLCLHHEHRATPLGSMELLKDLRIPESGNPVSEPDRLKSDLRNALDTIAALRAELARLETELRSARAPIWPDPWEDDPTQTETERNPPFPPQYRPHEEQPYP